MFALQPSLQIFRLVIQDNERGVSLSRAFSLKDYPAKIDLIGVSAARLYQTSARQMRD
jgi:hypothetical protein